MAVGSLGLAFLAGLLSILSPCVLPLLPIVLGSAAAEHRLAPLALAGGVALSFVAIGLFIATIGFSIGLDADVFRTAAAILMVMLGVVLVLIIKYAPKGIWPYGVAVCSRWFPLGQRRRDWEGAEPLIRRTKPEVGELLLDVVKLR